MRRISLLLTITKKKIYSIYFLVTVFSIIVFQMSFSSNDDNEVRAILDGTRFGRPDFHIPWISPLITYPISKLYEVAPQFYWYEIFLFALCIFSHLLILHILLKLPNQQNNVFQFILFLSVFVLQFKSLNSISYTNTSITVLGTSIALMITFLQIKQNLNLRNFFNFFFILALFLIGFALRPTTAVGVLVFLLPSIIYCFAMRFQILLITSAVISMGLVIWLIDLVDKMTYATSGWREWRKFTRDYLWPGDYNLLGHAINGLFPSMSQPELNLWLSANHIHPSQFTSRFFGALDAVQVKFDFLLFIQSCISVSRHYGLYLIIVLALSLILKFNARHLALQVTSSNMIRFAMRSNIAVFQCIYGIFLLFLLALYTKNVDRVFIGLILSLIVIVVVVEPENYKFSKKALRLDLLAGIGLVSLSLLAFQTIDKHPSLGKFVGGKHVLTSYQKAEIAALGYISQLPQCVDKNLDSQYCVLFLHTNSYPPFEPVPETNVRRLYLFWSAFSPTWKEVINGTGAEDSLDLLCSGKGFLLNSKESVGFVESFIKQKRHDTLKSVPLSSLFPKNDPNFEKIYLTVGTINRGCPQRGSS
jgi:hypothetical protein